MTTIICVFTPWLHAAGPATQQSSGWPTFTYFRYEPAQAQPAFVEPGHYRNPILPGCYPDPSICRVGDDFYLVHSTFAVFPGVPIFQSRDLVHWRQIGNVLHRPSQLNLDGLGVSEGVFAPAISYRDGTFYVVNTNVGHGGNYYVTATNPEGPWSDPVWLNQVNGVDPSLFFDDDGQGYLVHNGPPPNNTPLYDGHRTIRLHEFHPGRPDAAPGEGEILVDGGVDFSTKPSWIEGPHLFKRNGHYYLIAAEGGTGDNHSEVVFRADHVHGPYKAWKDNPILTQRSLPSDRPYKITSTGHADFVTTPDGHWWSVFLGIRPYAGPYSNIGRETFLLPVTWANDWPTILPPAVAVEPTHVSPALPSQTDETLDFDQPYESSLRTLDFSWVCLRTPRETWYTADAAGLHLEPRSIALTAKANPSMWMRRQQHHSFVASTTLQLPAGTADSQSGIVAFQNETHHFFLGVTASVGSATQVFLEQTNSGAADAKPELIATTVLPSDVHQIDLRIRATGQPYSFDYRLADGGWQSLEADVDGSILSTHTAGGFVGTYTGLYSRK